MINPNILIKEKIDQLPLEAVEVLKVLDELENFTLELRERLALELNPEEINSIKLKLDKVS
jgi:hypothetical protein